MNEKNYSRHQQKIIRNYYKNRSTLALQKLQDLVADLYLAETDKKRETLWKRAEKALKHLKVNPTRLEHILKSRDPEVLASNLKDWWAAPPGGGNDE